MTHVRKLRYFRIPGVFVRNFDCNVFPVFHLSVLQKRKITTFTISQINGHLKNLIGSKAALRRSSLYAAPTVVYFFEGFRFFCMIYYQFSEFYTRKFMPCRLKFAFRRKSNTMPISIQNTFCMLI